MQKRWLLRSAGIAALAVLALSSLVDAHGEAPTCPVSADSPWIDSYLCKPVASAGHAAPPAPVEEVAITVEGQVLDGICFANGLNGGPNHAICTRTCFARGQPALVRADDGTGWLLIADNGNEPLIAAAKELAGERVTLSGFVRTRGGVNALALTSVSAVRRTDSGS